MKTKRNLLKKVLTLGAIIYVVCIFANQQKVLNSYKTTQEYYSEQIEAELAQKEKLNNTKNNINSLEYIEQVAREKLDMYLPNERVFIDANK